MRGSIIFSSGRQPAVQRALDESACTGNANFKNYHYHISKCSILNNHATCMVDVSFMGRNVFIEWMKNEHIYHIYLTTYYFLKGDLDSPVTAGKKCPLI
jgi:hypothetical protein